MIALSYLWLLALVPFLVEKDDPEVKWHSRHGLVLAAAELIFWIALTIFNIVLTAIFAPIGCLFTIVFLVGALAIVGFHIYCIVKGVNGERILVPYVSEYADKF